MYLVLFMDIMPPANANYYHDDVSLLISAPSEVDEQTTMCLLNEVQVNM